MKRLAQFLFLSTLFLICGCENEETKKSAAYTSLQWGEYLVFYKKMDSAFLMFSQAAIDGNTQLEKATAYNYMGTMQRRTGDLYGAQESLTSALRSLDRNNPEHLDLITFVFNELGNTSLDLRRYDEAHSFYDSALSLTKVQTYIPEILNGKATALQKEKKYDGAIAIYDSIIRLQPANIALVARALSNRARTKWLQDSTYPALDEYQQALKIRLDKKDYPGLNASYAHLSDFYSKTNIDSALYYAAMMQEQAIKNESPDDILEAKDKLIRLNNSAAIKDRLYQDFKKLNDSLQLARDTTRSRFALIRYDVQKSKADNLVLQRHITNQRLLMSTIGVSAIAMISGLILWFRRRRLKLKQESDITIRNLKIATSQKVHDVVANGLYRIMNELEHREVIDKEPLLNDIEQLYERSRDLSYEDLSPGEMPAGESSSRNIAASDINPLKTFPEAGDPSTAENDRQFHDLLSGYANDDRRVVLIGNQQPFWGCITKGQKQQLFLILSEIMVNMKKHSGAKNILVQFRLEDRHAFINYKDDGIGFAPDQQFGNGLKNTVSRIKTINGQAIFGKNGDKGLTIELSFPLENIEP